MMAATPGAKSQKLLMWDRTGPRKKRLARSINAAQAAASVSAHPPILRARKAMTTVGTPMNAAKPRSHD